MSVGYREPLLHLAWKSFDGMKSSEVVKPNACCGNAVNAFQVPIDIQFESIVYLEVLFERGWGLDQGLRLLMVVESVALVVELFLLLRRKMSIFLFHNFRLLRNLRHLLENCCQQYLQIMGRRSCRYHSRWILEISYLFYPDSFSRRNGTICWTGSEMYL